MIRAVNQVSLTLPADTVICLGDAITLRPASDGLALRAGRPQPASMTLAQKPAVPLFLPTGSTHYTVTASISNCTATARHQRRAPCPIPRQCRARHHYLLRYLPPPFTPPQTRQLPSPGRPCCPSTLHPTRCSLAATTAYVLTATDTRGCPKPTMDTVLGDRAAESERNSGRRHRRGAGPAIAAECRRRAELAHGSRSRAVQPFYPEPGHHLQHRPPAPYGIKCSCRTKPAAPIPHLSTVKVYNTLPQVFVPTAFHAQWRRRQRLPQTHRRGH